MNPIINLIKSIYTTLTKKKESFSPGPKWRALIEDRIVFYEPGTISCNDIESKMNPGDTFCYRTGIIKNCNGQQIGQRVITRNTPIHGEVDGGFFWIRNGRIEEEIIGGYYKTIFTPRGQIINPAITNKDPHMYPATATMVSKLYPPAAPEVPGPAAPEVPVAPRHGREGEGEWVDGTFIANNNPFRANNNPSHVNALGEPAGVLDDVDHAANAGQILMDVAGGILGL